MYLIAYPDNTYTGFKPVRELHHDAAFELVLTLQAHRKDFDAAFICENFGQLIRAICLMLPTYPGVEWDIKQLLENPDIVDDLLLKPDCLFMQMHDFEPPERTKDPDEPPGDKLEDLPFPSGGQSLADQYASFMHAQLAPVDIASLVRELSRAELQSLVYTLGELANPEPRIKEEARRIAEEDYAGVLDTYSNMSIAATMAPKAYNTEVLPTDANTDPGSG